MSFDIKVKIDTQGVDGSLRKVEDSLADVEAAEQGVTAASKKLGNEFDDLDKHMQVSRLSAGKFVEGLGHMNHALELGGRALSFAEGTWNEYGQTLRLEAAAGAANIDRLSEASGGLMTEMDLLRFAAQAQHGELGKLNLAYGEKQLVMEKVLQAETALIRAGFEADDVHRKLLDSTIKLSEEGLDDLGLAFKEGATQAETLKNYTAELDRVIAQNANTTSAAADEVQRLGVMWANAKHSLMEYAGATLSLESMKQGRGALFDTANVLTFGQAGRNLDDRTTREANASLGGVQDVMSGIKTSSDEALDSINATLRGAVDQTDQYADGWKMLHGLMSVTVDDHRKTTHAIREQAAAELDLVGMIRQRIAVEEAARRNGQEGHDERFFQDMSDRGLKEQEENEREWKKQADELKKQEDERTKAADSAARKRAENEARAAADLVKSARESAEKYKEAWATAGGQVAGGFLKMAADGERSISEMVEISMQKLAMLAIQIEAARMGGSGGAFVGSLAGALSGGRNGFDYMASDSPLQLPGFARGGDMTVRGAGSQDSHLAMFMVSPGESIHVRTPQQRMAETAPTRSASREARNESRPRTTINLVDDRGGMLDTIGSYEGDRVFAKKQRKLGRRRTG